MIQLVEIHAWSYPNGSIMAFLNKELATTVWNAYPEDHTEFIGTYTVPVGSIMHRHAIFIESGYQEDEEEDANPPSTPIEVSDDPVA
jgi:hypothetical protein